MSAATESVKKQMKGWGAAYYITEFLPLTAGIITAMVYNPSVWQWLIFIFLGILIIGGIILAVRHSWKTLVWGLMLVLCLGLNGWVMYTIIGSCFAFASVNDL